MLRKILPQQLRTRSFAGVPPMNHKSTSAANLSSIICSAWRKREAHVPETQSFWPVLDVPNHLEPPRGSGVLQKLEKALSSNFRENS